MAEHTDSATLAASTPSYPTLRAELGPDYVALDRQRLEPAPGQGLRECLVAALAARAQELRGPEGSVRAQVATAGASGEWEQFSAVVTASGQVIDTTSPDQAEGRRGRRRPHRIVTLVASAMAVLVLAGVAVTAVVLHPFDAARARSGPAPRPAAAASTPTVYPRPAPAGWSSVARWSAAIASNSRPVVGPNGLVITATEEKLQARRPRTGSLVWQQELPSAARAATASGGLHISRVGGRPAVVAQARDQLLWWPLDGRAHRRRSVPLPAGAEVSFAGSTPLVTIPGQHAGLVAGERLVDRVVPAKATALAAFGDTVLAADTAGHVWRLTAASPQFPPEPVTLAAPDGAQGKPHVVGVADRLLVTIWAAKDKPNQRIVALSDPRSGDPVAAQAVAAEGLEGAQWHVAPSHHLAALGDVVIDADQRTISQVPGLKPWIALDGVVYGVTEQDALVAVTNDGTTRPAGGGVVPVALARGWAIVTATVRSETTVYALPPGDGAERSSTPSARGTPSAHPRGGSRSAPTPVSPPSASRPPGQPSNPTPEGGTR